MTPREVAIQIADSCDGPAPEDLILAYGERVREACLKAAIEADQHGTSFANAVRALDLTGEKP